MVQAYKYISVYVYVYTQTGEQAFLKVWPTPSPQAMDHMKQLSDARRAKEAEDHQKFQSKASRLQAGKLLMTDRLDIMDCYKHPLTFTPLRA